MGSSNFRRNVGLHIDGDCACLMVQAKLFGGAEHQGIHARDMGSNCSWKKAREPLGPNTIGRNEFFAAPDPGGYDPITSGEIGCQSTRDSKADNT